MIISTTKFILPHNTAYALIYLYSQICKQNRDIHQHGPSSLAVSKPGQSFGLVISADFSVFIIGNLSSANQRSFKQIFYELHLVTLFYLTLQDFFLQSIVIIIAAFIGLFLTGTDSASFVS